MSDRLQTRLCPGSEAGSAAVELAVLTPVLVLVLLLIVAAGRLVLARQEVNAAAADAARAASLAVSPAAAEAVATSAVKGDLGTDHITCDPFTARVDTTHFAPGGVVSVSVTCTTSLSDLALLRLPGQTTLSAASASPIDRYRALDPSG